MIERKKHINNPLTLITIFAGIPIACIYAIKYVNPEHQFFFICFVIVFTILLMLLTFTILLFKPGVLYAPSDFKDERNFLITNKIKKVERRKEIAK